MNQTRSSETGKEWEHLLFCLAVPPEGLIWHWDCMNEIHVERHFISQYTRIVWGVIRLVLLWKELLLDQNRANDFVFIVSPQPEICHGHLQCEICILLFIFLSFPFFPFISYFLCNYWLCFIGTYNLKANNE